MKTRRKNEKVGNEELQRKEGRKYRKTGRNEGIEKESTHNGKRNGKQEIILEVQKKEREEK